MRMARVRVGVIGVAVDRHPRVHLRALNSMEDVELVAFCDINEPILEKACEEYGVTQRFLDRREMLDKAKMDAVWVVCNYRFTYDVAMDCLAAGVNTFMEKPPGLSIQECRQMADTAAKSGCKGMVGFNRRFNRVIAEAKRLLEGSKPALGFSGPGGIRAVDANFGKPRAVGRFTDKDGHPVPPLRVDAIHHVDALRYLLGDAEVERVMGACARHYSQEYDSFHALIKFKGGAIAQLNSNYNALKLERISLFAEEAWAELLGLQEQQINSGKAYVDGCWHELREDVRPGRTDSLGFWDEVRFFIDCVKDDKPVAYPACDLNNGVKTLELVNAILADA
jgi:predicted dehydrogenase